MLKTSDQEVLLLMTLGVSSSDVEWGHSTHVAYHALAELEQIVMPEASLITPGAFEGIMSLNTMLHKLGALISLKHPQCTTQPQP